MKILPKTQPDRLKDFFGVLTYSLLLCALLSASVGQVTSPRAASAETEIQPTFTQWLREIRSQARQQGVSRETLNEALDGLKPNPTILERSENQAEFTIPFDKYRGYFLTPEMIEKGRAQIEENKELLQSLENKYGVPRGILVAVWGVESRYGTHPSDHDALVALASLGYRHARKNQYFENQLLQTLQMIDDGQLSLPLRGSWAGALGQPQFMPTSYQEYAVDFDGDGTRDIWESTPDILGSIANYLSKHGWHENSPWVQSGHSKQESDPNSRVLNPEGANQSYRVYSNFDVLLRYNQSNFYALTVGILANKLQEDS